MTAKEELHRRVDALSDEQAEQLLVAAEEALPSDIIDEWGNLSSLVRSSTRDTLKRLDAEDGKGGFS